MKIEKLRNPYVRGNEGCSVSMIDLLEKINEIIDAMNVEHDPADIYSEDGRLIAKKDESDDERIRKWLIDYFSSIKETVWIHRDITCKQILAYLEKQKEPSWKPGEEQMRDLEEAADNFANQDCARFTPRFNGFIAGAKWQKEQMLKEAVEGEIQMRYSGSLCAKTIRAINEDKFKFGDKVRIIIVKENEK